MAKLCDEVKPSTHLCILHLCSAPPAALPSFRGRHKPGDGLMVTVLSPTVTVSPTPQQKTSNQLIHPMLCILIHGEILHCGRCRHQLLFSHIRRVGGGGLISVAWQHRRIGPKYNQNIGCMVFYVAWQQRRTGPKYKQKAGS